MYSRRGEGRTFFPYSEFDYVFDKLDVAVAKPRAQFAGKERYVGLFEKVAALGHAIASGHTFGNGNKRTAFTTMMLAMMANGWRTNMPPPVVAVVMLRVANHNQRMTVEELATVLAAFSRPAKPNDEATEVMARSVRSGAITVDGDDLYPAERPADYPPTEARERAKDILDRHIDLMTPEEMDLFEQHSNWSSQMMRNVSSYQAVQQHAIRYALIRRRAGKCVGKRRRPHCGGRSIPRVCPPLCSKNGVHHSPKGNSKG